MCNFWVKVQEGEKLKKKLHEGVNKKCGEKDRQGSDQREETVASKLRFN